MFSKRTYDVVRVLQFKLRFMFVCFVSCCEIESMFGESTDHTKSSDEPK